MRELIIVDYRPEWPHMFAEERERLADVFGTRFVAIEHFGSTSVPGLAAKPCIDIQVQVSVLEQPEDYAPLVAEIGYLPFDSGENDVRIVFYKDDPGRYNLSIVRAGSWAALRPILFRDYLRAHSDALAEYAALKRRLADESDPHLSYSDKLPTYTLNKTAFVERMVEIAAREAGLPYRPGNQNIVRQPTARG